MSKVRASNIEISISKEAADNILTPPEELTKIECEVTSFGWDFGSAEEEDVTPLCEAEARHTEYSLRGKGTITLDMFFAPKGEAYKSILASNKDLKKRYIKVVYKDDVGEALMTREILGTVESVNETAEVGNHVKASISIGTSGAVVQTDGGKE